MKRTVLLAFAAALLLSTLVACAAPTTGTAAFQKITPQDAKTRLDSDKSIVLVDVRTQEEYDQSHIAGALLLPVDMISTKAVHVLLDKNATYFVYCRSGNRSATAARTLADLGFTEIYDLGGIQDWPYETVR